MPSRVQLSRARGWRKPANTVVVARPSKWGNPFRVGDCLVKTGGALAVEVVESATATDVVAAFRQALENPRAAPVRANIRANLAGKNLACWCRLDAPCHADVLLEVANTPEAAQPSDRRQS